MEINLKNDVTMFSCFTLIIKFDSINKYSKIAQKKSSKEFENN